MVTHHPSNRRTACIPGNGILRPETFANGASARADRPISGETCAFPRSVVEESGQLSGPRHSSPLQRHSENETRFLGRGSGYKSAAVRLSDLRGDVKAKSETLPAIADIAAEERLEELGHC
jgi:hypothetical protein